MKKRKQEVPFTVCEFGVLIVILFTVAVAFPQEEPPGDKPETAITHINQIEPTMLLNPERYSDLVKQVPLWSLQLLRWYEREVYSSRIGLPSEREQDAAYNWLKRVLRDELCPPDVKRYLMPVRGWFVIDKEWQREGGADAFLIKYQTGDFVLHLAETPTHILIGARKLDRTSLLPPEDHLPFVYQTAIALFKKPLLPESLSDLGEGKKGGGTVTAGYWAPPVEAAKNASEEDAIRESISSGVQFCTDGGFVTFMIMKYLWGIEPDERFTGRFKIPFEKVSDEAIQNLVNEFMRNHPELDTPARRDEFAVRLREIIDARKWEEYLGPRIYDSTGRPIVEYLPPADLARAFHELNLDDQALIIKECAIEEHYTHGLESFEQGDINHAIKSFVNVLRMDPMNARAALLLKIALENKVTLIRAIDGTYDERNEYVVMAKEALDNHGNAVLLERRKRTKEYELWRLVMLHRTNAIEYYVKGDFERAAREWEVILKIDPGNPSAILYYDMMAKKRQRSGNAAP